MSKKIATGLSLVEALFETDETLQNMAHEYVADSSAQNARALRKAAFEYAEAARAVEG